MESYFRVSADAADTDKRVRREYMRFVWRKRRAHICPDLFFACDSLRHSSGVHIPCRGARRYELLFVGIACLLYMLLLPNIASSMLGRGRRAAGAVYDFTRRIPSSCTAAEAKKKRRCIPISRRSSELSPPVRSFCGRKTAATVSKGRLYFGRSRSLRRVHFGALRQRSPRFRTDAGGAPFSQSARSFLPR